MTAFTFPPFSHAAMTRGGAPKKVLVLGAGMSGLAAAYELRRAGHDVVVVEGKVYPGGRVQTLRDGFSPGLHADGGAAFIPGSHTLSVGFALQFGLKLDPIPTGSGATVDYIAGTRLPETTAAAAAWPVTLNATEAGQPPISWLLSYTKTAMQEILATDPRAPGWPPPALQALDRVTFHEYLTSQGASEGAISVLRLGFPDLWGNGIDTTSALLVLRDTAYAFASYLTSPPPPPATAPSTASATPATTPVTPSGAAATGVATNSSAAPPASRHHRSPAAFVPQGPPANSPAPASPAPATNGAINPNALYRIRGGSDVYPAAFGVRIGPHIQFGRTVTRIEQSATGVRVECDGGDEVFEADYAICTLPFVVLKDIVVVPAFPQDKASAIQDLPYTSVTRVFLEFTSRFWRAAGCNGTAATDLPTSPLGPRPGLWIEDATATEATTRGVLDCYYAGPAAREIGALGYADRVSRTLASVNAVFPGATEYFSGNAMAKCWDEDPFARGDYCWYRPGQLTALTPIIQRPEGRIHFAGDHASALPGWIQGALESGLRAAREVNDAP